MDTSRYTVFPTPTSIPGIRSSIANSSYPAIAMIGWSRDSSVCMMIQEKKVPLPSAPSLMALGTEWMQYYEDRCDWESYSDGDELAWNA